jgi:hypothetical protein
MNPPAYVLAHVGFGVRDLADPRRFCEAALESDGARADFVGAALASKDELREHSDGHVVAQRPPTGGELLTQPFPRRFLHGCVTLAIGSTGRREIPSPCHPRHEGGAGRFKQGLRGHVGHHSGWQAGGRERRR